MTTVVRSKARSHLSSEETHSQQKILKEINIFTLLYKCSKAQTDIFSA